MPSDFTKLRIWVKSEELCLSIYKLTAQYPSEEKYSLISQTRRSSNSVSANIAEATGRYFKKDKIRVLYISRGELEETRSHLIIGKHLGYCTEEQHNEIDQQYIDLRKEINSFIKYLETH